MANQEHLEILKRGDWYWNAWRSANPEIRPDLRDANLAALDFCVPLNNTMLDGASLYNKNLFNETFQGASLRFTKLHNADLRRVTFIDADLSNADLILANLTEANLRNANLTNATFGWTVLGNNDLSEVRGLEMVQHIGPSTIGIDTIYRSGGRIPEAFLLGCGVPSSFVAYAQALVNAEDAIHFYSCFISHSTHDKEFCDQLYRDLEASHVRTWYFREDARWGESVWGEIDASIRVNDKLILVCSRDSLNSPAVAREISRCLAREDLERRNILFPIRIDNYIFEEWQNERKQDVVDKVIGDFRGWQTPETYRTAFQSLLEHLRTAN